MQLSPNSLIPVSYTASIPGDTTLYYVRAVLRDTQSGNTLQTINLVNVSTTPNRYQGVFQPVSDPSGLGRAVDITVSVYTDSAYTLLSSNYQIYQTNYVILQPWIQNLGTGGGLNIDYVKLQKMFDGSKVTNAEIGNEKPPVRFNYKRLEEGTLGAHEATRGALSKELKGHVENISSLLTSIAEDNRTSSDSHSKVLATLDTRITSLERTLNEGTKLSSSERAAMKEELAGSIKDFREEYKTSSSETPKATEKLLKEAFVDIQEYIESNLSEKEIKINYTPTSRKKEEKEKPLFAPEHIQALLR